MKKIWIETKYPIAFDSPDHIMPLGTANDNHKNLNLLIELENYFKRKIKLLDLGCSGGGFIKDAVDGGNFAIGLEGSDYSVIHQRAEWPELYLKNLFTCDVSKSYNLFEYDSKSISQIKFDVISAWEVIEHIHPNDLETFFKNIRNHLADDGFFIGSISCKEEIIQGKKLHQSVYSAKTWINEILPKYLDVYKYPFENALRNDFCSVLVKLKKKKSLEIKQSIKENIGIVGEYPGYSENDGMHFSKDLHSTYFNLAKKIQDDIIIPNKINKILELGCGAGSLAYHIKQLNKNINNDIVYCTVDGNPKTYDSPYINFDKNHFIAMTDENYELTNDKNEIIKFDLILSFEHLEHIQENKFEKFLLNITKHMHENSLLLVSISNYETEDNRHVFIRDKNFWINYFENMNFEIIKSNFITQETKPFNFEVALTNEFFLKLINKK